MPTEDKHGMAVTEPLRIAIVSPGDRAERATATGDAGRFADLFQALRTAGHDVSPAIYHDDFCDEVRAQLLETDVVLVWTNPVQGGRTRAQLDAMLREVVDAGVYVSTDPDVLLKLGTKQVLFDTRELGWGTDTKRYQSVTELCDGLVAGLPSGPRVIKQHRGSSGDGIFRVALVEPGPPVDLNTTVRIRHAKRGSEDEIVSVDDFCARCAPYFEAGSVVIDQAFVSRLAEGMIRCYLVGGQVAGFGHQAINALIPVAPGSEPPTPSQRIYHPPTLPDFQHLKSTLETEWVPALQRLFDLRTEQLPMLWDCDFLLGPPDLNGQDTYVLCEINVSSVAPYPSSAVEYMVEAIADLASRR